MSRQFKVVPKIPIRGIKDHVIKNTEVLNLNDFEAKRILEMGHTLYHNGDKVTLQTFIPEEEEISITKAAIEKAKEIKSGTDNTAATTVEDTKTTTATTPAADTAATTVEDTKTTTATTPVADTKTTTTTTPAADTVATTVADTTDTK